MITYEGLNAKLAERGITKTALSEELGISSRTIAKIAKGKKLGDTTLRKIASFLECDPSQLCREISENAILQLLRDEKNAKISGGLYHELQVRMTYNSNHIEGSRLTHDQTRYIFETNTIGLEGESVNVDDVVETANHFRCIDLIIDNASKPLTEAFIKELHRTLKSGTSDSRQSWFAVGAYKKVSNEVGGQTTALPSQVPAAMAKLLKGYNSIPEPDLEDLLDFHVCFERIHPFQDGNGRVGRLILFKECLRFGIVPFIIDDRHKMFYYRGLKEWDKMPGYLRDTCLLMQDDIKAVLDYFGIKYEAAAPPRYPVRSRRQDPDPSQSGSS